MSLLPLAHALGLQGKYLCTPYKLMPTLNSSLKSLPSSAERIRYSSSSESRGIGKYLLDGEGDLGRRTTVCSPVFRGIYVGQTANTSQKRTLEALIAPAKTSMKAIKMSQFCGQMTGMISWVINMLLHETVTAHDLASSLFNLFIFFPINDSLPATKSKSLLKLSHLPWTSDCGTFQVHKNVNLQLK